VGEKFGQRGPKLHRAGGPASNARWRFSPDGNVGAFAEGGTAHARVVVETPRQGAAPLTEASAGQYCVHAAAFHPDDPDVRHGEPRAAVRMEAGRGGE